MEDAHAQRQILMPCCAARRAFLRRQTYFFAYPVIIRQAEGGRDSFREFLQLSPCFDSNAAGTPSSSACFLSATAPRLAAFAATAAHRHFRRQRRDTPCAADAQHRHARYRQRWLRDAFSLP